MLADWAPDLRCGGRARAAHSSVPMTSLPLGWVHIFPDFRPTDHWTVVTVPRRIWAPQKVPDIADWTTPEVDRRQPLKERHQTSAARLPDNGQRGVGPGLQRMHTRFCPFTLYCSLSLTRGLVCCDKTSAPATWPTRRVPNHARNRPDDFDIDLKTNKCSAGHTHGQRELSFGNHLVDDKMLSTPNARVYSRLADPELRSFHDMPPEAYRGGFAGNIHQASECTGPTCA